MGYSDEFPNLRPLGLYAASITGDGNCLFNALSDQLHGTQQHHHDIRLKVVQYMRENKDDYTPFLDVLPGGATRRNPKRKNAATFSSSFDSEMPTPEDIDRAFEDRLRRMGQGGTYGDNFEIVAFTCAYAVDVMVFQANERLYFHGPRTQGQKQICCIAYHTWEHYSSIRNTDGPHSGPPQVRLKELTIEELTQMKAPASGPINIPQWQIDEVMRATLYSVNEPTVIRVLEERHGDSDSTILQLLGELDSPDRTPSVQSSSVEPTTKTDDEQTDVPNKKQDRRMSRATKSANRTRQRRQRELLRERLSSSSLERLEAAASASGTNSGRRRRFSRVILDEDDTEMEDSSTPPPLSDGSTSSASDYSISISPPKPPITLKLNLKPPQPSQQEQSSPPRLVPSKSFSKAPQPRKRLNAARDIKSLKKQAQKQAAKERRQAAAKPHKEESTLSFSSNGSSQSSVSNGFRLLHV